MPEISPRRPVSATFNGEQFRAEYIGYEESGEVEITCVTEVEILGVKCAFDELPDYLKAAIMDFAHSGKVEFESQ